ncbi:MAG: hypothetical protein KDA24_08895 [Deltaproteobacteria bacterium]|nr:hypothetical protein [Deltaproteobacteria bacterium]
MPRTPLPSLVAASLLVAAFLLCTFAPGSVEAEEAVPGLQSDGRGVKSSARTVDISDLDLDLEVDVVGGTVKGTATHTLTPLRTGLLEIRLHAVALDVSVVTIDGAAAPFRVLPEQLAITLPAPSVRGATHTVAVTYSASPQLGLHFRRPGPTSPDTYAEAWSQGENTDNRHWFPTWDEPNDRFTYRGAFTVADRFTAVSNGRMVNKQPARPGWTTWTYTLQEQDLVSYLVMFAAAEYRLVSERWRERPLIGYLPPDVDDATGQRALARTADMLDFMSSVTGTEYPYPGYSQVFVQRFIYTGMENTTATVLERNLLFPEELAAHKSGTESVVAHELAHQWFGDQLTCRDWSHMWLNEGITTFLEGWWWDHAHGPEEGADKKFGRVNGTVQGEKKNARPLVVDFFTREGTRQSHNVYRKGSALMWGLRALLGEADFGEAFRAYVSRNQHGMVTTDDLQRAFEEASGLDLDWYFQQWAYLAGHPVLEVKHAWDAEQGTLRVDLAQTQEVTGNTPLFVLPVDLEIGTPSGIQRHRVWLEGAEASLVLPLAGGVSWVGVDPEGGLLADVQQTQTDAEWSAILGSDASAYSKRLAWHAVVNREQPPDETLRAAVVGTLMSGDAHHVWRGLAAEALGEWKDESSVQTLIRALGRFGGTSGTGAPGLAAQTRLQATLGRVLGKAPASPGVIAALKALHARGGNEYVTSRALQALSKVDGDEALPLARADLARDGGHNNQRWRYAFDVLGAHGDRKDLDRLDRFRSPNVFHWSRSSALRASAKIANRQPLGDARDAARRHVAKDAEATLADLNLRGVQGAVGILGSVGDLDSVKKLQAARSACTVGVVRDAMTGAIESIRTRKEEDPEPKEDDGQLTAQVKKLQEQLDALGERLDALQDKQ